MYEVKEGERKKYVESKRKRDEKDTSHKHVI